MEVKIQAVFIIYYVCNERFFFIVKKFNLKMKLKKNTHMNRSSISRSKIVVYLTSAP